MFILEINCFFLLFTHKQCHRPSCTHIQQNQLVHVQGKKKKKVTPCLNTFSLNTFSLLWHNSKLPILSIGYYTNINNTDIDSITALLEQDLITTER